MYLVATGVPFFPAPTGATYLPATWAGDLLRLRDSFDGKYGPIVVAAPTVPYADGVNDGFPVVRYGEDHDGLSFVDLGFRDQSKRQFWLNTGHVRGVYRKLLADADVVHSGIINLYVPFGYLGFREAVRAGTPTVFVIDLDVVDQIRAQNRHDPAWRRFKDETFLRVYERVARRAVSQADLTLLKGKELFDRYGTYAKNARDTFHVTYSESDIISQPEFDERNARVLEGEPLRFLYLGRFVPRKNMASAIRAIAAAAETGANIRLDFIGAGPEENALKELVAELGAEDFVTFHGSKTYGPGLLKEIRQFHIMLNIPVGSDTPRAIFDGLCAGLASVASDTEYFRSIVNTGPCGVLVPPEDVDRLAETFVTLDRDRPRVSEYMRAARALAFEHSAEKWYRRRAEWTIEAVDRARAAKSRK